MACTAALHDKADLHNLADSESLSPDMTLEASVSVLHSVPSQAVYMSMIQEASPLLAFALPVVEAGVLAVLCYFGLTSCVGSCVI